MVSSSRIVPSATEREEAGPGRVRPSTASRNLSVPADLALVADVPLACADADGRHQWWNDAYRTFSGRTDDELEILKLGEVLGRPTHFDLEWERALSGHRGCFEMRRPTATDEGEYYLTRLKPHRNSETGRLQVAVSVEDQTGPRRALSDLQRYASMVSYSMDAIFSLDQRGMIETWNAGAQNLFGYTADEVLGQPLTLLAAPETTLLETLPEQVLEGNVVEGDDLHRCRNGTVLRVSIQASPIYHRVLGISGVGLVARDVTDRHAIEQELRAAKERAEQAAIAKSRFLANMSHEIRTPMNGVLGMTDLLLETDLNREQREYAGAVKSSGDTLLQLINDILDFSKIEAGRLELEDIPFDVSATCEAVLDVVGPFAAQKDIELTGYVDLDLPPRIFGDPSRLRQVLLNLTNNAVKFTTEGEVALRVRHAPGDRIRFEVEDTGIGIPAERVEQLFTAFTQVDSSTTRRFGGTGLGLAISRELVELMGGRIEVDSIEGVGSRFWFDLPLRPEIPETPPAELAALDVLRGLRVLVVDDIGASRDVVRRYCEAWGCQVAVADNEATATSLVAQAEEAKQPYAVILLDNGLPEVPGLELGRRWQSRWPSSPTIRVLLTSYAERGDARRAQDAGFAAYLTKPTKKGTLRDVLLTVLGSAPRGPAPRRLVTRHSVVEDRRRKTRILVAEDNPVNQKVVLRMLERLGFRPTLVADGRLAVERFSAEPFDIVLMDCQMPHMDGYEATGRIRELGERGAWVPIVAMTAHAMKGDREKCLAAGMSHYLAKPISSKGLAQVLESLIPKEE